MQNVNLASAILTGVCSFLTYHLTSLEHQMHYSTWTKHLIKIMLLARSPLPACPWLSLASWIYSDHEVIKLSSYSTQLSTKFILLINVKMPTIVGILTFISLKNTTFERLKARHFFICRYFSFYEGCSNMNASSFLTFFTYVLRQNGKRFYKGLYVTFKLAQNLKKNTVCLTSYSPSNEGHVSILTNSMLQTYTSDIDERIILR